MWPKRIELEGSRYPRRLRLAALGVTGAGLLISGLPAGLAAFAGLAAMVLARRWRPPVLCRAEVAPERVRLELADRRVLELTPPFRVLLRPSWLALHCPGQGWVCLFPDQAGAVAVTPLRQVLWMQRRR